MDKLRTAIDEADMIVMSTWGEALQVARVWLLFGPGGQRALCPAPDGLDKDDEVQVMRALMRHLGVTHYVMVDEAWTLTGGTREQIETLDSLENHPDRVEVVIYHAEDRDRLLVGERAIIRPADGKATLGPLQVYSLHRVEGRLVGLLSEPPGKPS